MRDLLLDPAREVVAALARRLGTAFSAFLVAQGIPHETAQQAMLAVLVLAGIGTDLTLSYWKRSK